MVDIERRRGKTTPARRRSERPRAESVAERPQHGPYAPPTLDPKSRADASVRVLLRSLLDAMQSRQAGVRRDAPEALHDLRVAVRRARCLVGQLRDAMDDGAAERLRAELRGLGTATGPQRERDVLLESLESSRPALPPVEARALDAVTALVRRERDAAHRELLEALASARQRRLLDEWERIAAEPDRRPVAGAPPREETELRARPIGEVAAKAIDRAWRRVLRCGRAVAADAPANAFHRVRIDGKKLRYLLELFRSAYPAVDLGPTIAALKGLQDCLGELNDTFLREEALRRLGHALAAGGADADTLLAVGCWMERARAGGAVARSRFSDRFALLAAKENRRRIRALAG